jgi:hypothetical protein
MAVYRVFRGEVWVQPVEIEACSEREAIDKVWRGEGTVLDNQLEFSHMLGTDTWTAERDKGDAADIRKQGI